MIQPTGDRQFLFLNILYAACILIGIGTIYTYFSKINVDVRRSPKHVGRVERAYITEYTDYGGRQTKRFMVFAFKLDQSTQILGVHWTSENYADLIDSVRVGDEVKVYYQPSTASGVNLDVFQIEKGNAIILNYENYRHQSIVFAYKSGALVVFLFLVAQVVKWVRKRRGQSD